MAEAPVQIRLGPQKNMNKNNFTDKTIVCQQCKQEFCWTAEEQEFYTRKKLKPPKKCLICRAAFQTAKKDKFRGKLQKI